MKAFLVRKSHSGVWTWLLGTALFYPIPCPGGKFLPPLFPVFDSLPSMFTPMLHCINPSCCTKAT